MFQYRYIFLVILSTIVYTSHCSEEKIAQKRAFKLCGILAGFDEKKGNFLLHETKNKHSDLATHCADWAIIEFMCRSGALETLDKNRKSRFSTLCTNAYHSILLYEPSKSQENLDLEKLKESIKKEIERRIKSTSSDFDEKKSSSTENTKLIAKL